MTETAKTAKLEKLKAKQDAIKAEIQKVQNQQKSKNKKNDTRRKILVGSYYLEQAEKKGEMAEIRKAMDEFLKRKNDRILFGLKET